MIFAVVAGVLVLLVVGWLLLNQQNASNDQRALTHLKNVGVALEAASSSTTAQQNITVLGTLRFACGDAGTELWYGTDAVRSIPGSIIFGSEVTTTMTIRSAPIGNAYRIGNAVYATPPRWAGNDVEYVPSATVLGAGVVSFDELNGDYPYFSPALLEGAKVSGNAQIYACGLTQALKRHRFATRVQRERVEMLIAEYAQDDSVCADLYNVEPFYRIEDSILSKGTGATKEASSFFLADAEALVEAERQIEQMNSNLVRASCATVS